MALEKTELKMLAALLEKQKMLAFIDAELKMKKRELEVHQSVWNQTLNKLKIEIVKCRSGVDLSNLTAD